MKRSILLSLIAAITLTVTGCSKSGTFTGSATGMQGPVTVEMKVEKGKITGVDVTECHETTSIASVALERIPAQIVQYQTTKVDVVTGATLASRALMSAATEAATAAGLNIDRKSVV